MEAFKQYIQQFLHYKPTIFESIIPFLSVQHLKAGEYFLREGKTSKQIAFIEQGLVRLYYLNNGKEIASRVTSISLTAVK